MRVKGEECDDGNQNFGDGWNSSWKIETGYQWTGGSISTKDAWTPIWGDGRRVGNEEWDDSNTVSGDGWSNIWKIESYWEWTGGSGNQYYFWINLLTNNKLSFIKRHM